MARQFLTRVLALAAIFAAGCSSAPGIVSDGCTGCDMAGGGGEGGGGDADGGGSCAGGCDMPGGVVATCGGDPTCVFAPPLAYRRGRNAYGVAAAKLDGDGRPDLVVSHAYDVSVRLAAAGGGFLPETVYDAGAYPHRFAFGDVDGDGRTDVLVTSGNDKLFTALVAASDG